MAVKLHTEIGNRKVSRRSLDQTYSETILERTDSSTDAGSCDTQGFRRPCKPVVLNYLGKYEEIIEILHSCASATGTIRANAVRKLKRSKPDFPLLPK